MIIIDIVLLIILLITAFWQGCLIYAQILGAPSVYANKNAIIKACQLAELKRGQTLVDLGCGDARSLIIAAQKFGANGIGIERSPYCYLLSKLNVYLSGQKNIKILFGDIQKFPDEIKKADVVYVYLLNSVLKKIENWLFKNIKTDAKIVSLAFKFSNHKPVKTAKVKNLGVNTDLSLY